MDREIIVRWRRRAWWTLLVIWIAAVTMALRCGEPRHHPIYRPFDELVARVLLALEGATPGAL